MRKGTTNKFWFEFNSTKGQRMARSYYIEHCGRAIRKEFFNSKPVSVVFLSTKTVAWFDNGRLAYTIGKRTP